MHKLRRVWVCAARGQRWDQSVRRTNAARESHNQINSVLAKTSNKSRYVSTDECRIKSATIYAHPSKIAKMQGLNQPMQQLTPKRIIVTVADNKTVTKHRAAGKRPTTFFEASLRGSSDHRRPYKRFYTTVCKVHDKLKEKEKPVPIGLSFELLRTGYWGNAVFWRQFAFRKVTVDPELYPELGPFQGPKLLPSVRRYSKLRLIWTYYRGY